MFIVATIATGAIVVAIIAVTGETTLARKGMGSTSTEITTGVIQGLLGFSIMPAVIEYCIFRLYNRFKRS